MYTLYVCVCVYLIETYVFEFVRFYFSYLFLYFGYYSSNNWLNIYIQRIEKKVNNNKIERKNSNQIGNVEEAFNTIKPLLFWRCFQCDSWMRMHLVYSIK